MRRVAPLTRALTVCRFGLNRRGPTLWACETVRPTAGLFPQTSQRLAMWSSVAFLLGRNSHITSLWDDDRARSPRWTLQWAAWHTEEATHQIEVGGGARGLGRALHVLRASCDRSQHQGGLPVINGGPLLLGVLDGSAECGRQALSRHGGGQMLVDDAFRRCLERSCGGLGGLTDIGVCQPAERIGLVGQDDCLEEKVQLPVPFGEVLDARHQYREVALLLAPHGGRRMVPCRRQMWTARRAMDGFLPLRPTAGMANGVTKR